MSGKYWGSEPEYERARVHDEDPDSSTSVRTEYTRYNILSSSEWLLEILTSIASLIIFAGVVYIFWQVDGEPLSSWKHPISINALVSLLTTACAAALMHSVSECISQLKWLHFRRQPEKLENFERFDSASRGPWGSVKFLATVKWNLATFGALITIFRLGFAPLAQQVVNIETRRFTIPGNGDEVTFGFAHTYSRNNASLQTSTKDLQDPNMQAAIVQGLYNITTFATFNCPGECLWEDSYMSLGFKAECNNVTQATLRSENCVKEGVTKYCNMTTPAGMNISTQNVETHLGTSFQMRVSQVPEGSPEIVRFAVYRSTSDNNFAPNNINITECSLSVTAYKYTAAHANGTAFSFGNIEEIDLGGKNAWASVGTGMLSTNESKVNNIPAFAIGYREIRTLSDFFKSLFTAEVVAGFYTNEDTGLSAALTGDVDIGGRFEKMAASMTDYVRSGPNSQLARGDVVLTEAYVITRWLWLVAPATIELSAILFTGLTIFISRKSRQVPLWKSSALAVLACEHETASQSIRATVKDIKEIEKTAENMSVRMG